MAQADKTRIESVVNGFSSGRVVPGSRLRVAKIYDVGDWAVMLDPYSA